MKPEFTTDRASAADIERHLATCDHSFHPDLSSRVDVAEYSRKIATLAIRFEAWSDNALVGLVAAYCTDPVGSTAFLTNVSVTPDFTGLGIARRLMSACRDHASKAGFARLELEVDARAHPALSLYTALGFQRVPTDTASSQRMVLELAKSQFLRR